MVASDIKEPCHEYTAGLITVRLTMKIIPMEASEKKRM
jgi:hypothetical protein